MVVVSLESLERGTGWDGVAERHRSIKVTSVEISEDIQVELVRSYFNMLM
jgi:hypothetical protein